jgi:dTDP-glucose 4,6-dehydratase
MPNAKGSGYGRVAVIGCNSFSGAWFVRHLTEQGYDVLGMSRSPEADRVFLPYRWTAGATESLFRFVRADLNHDVERIVREIRDFGASYVVNFAAQSMVAESWDAPADWYQTNVVANVKLHEGLRRLKLEKYVHVSTPEVYGSCSGLVTEDQPFNPSTPYAASRAACDLHLRTFIRQHKFPAAFTRAANVFGPGQALYRIIPKTALCCLTGQKLPLHGGGHSTRSFIHIRDVADGTRRVMLEAQPGEVFHLSTDRHVSIRQVVEMICQATGVPFERVAEVDEERPGKDAAYLLDSSRAVTRLGWKAQTSLEEGVGETIAWVRENLELLRTLPMKYHHKP